jgi:predicted transcriptional regulator
MGNKPKNNLVNPLSKIDIRVSSEVVIVGNRIYYKIWILQKETKNNAHIKDYYSLELLTKKSQSPITLIEILEMVRINADVPDDFEEYCEMQIEYLDGTHKFKTTEKGLKFLQMHNQIGELFLTTIKNN